MNILFIGYWGINEGLTQATIVPHLKILSTFPTIKKIIFSSVERNEIIGPQNLSIPKTTHFPFTFLP